ncbi:MAG TPA: SUMF1/EgtB/PvdO family nonheme iron enzyme [Candidatus Kapabacteria bacterium]|nr:SUMF1/EgtB/PvdO family nonheme iron enzyme [Candidatus Kapabacteria bacterium]HPO63997.1 SUMF1/EgtB/PvdO family nonheme iron enzyme [Candidatus Kapabacteria bacterium]
MFFFIYQKLIKHTLNYLKITNYLTTIFILIFTLSCFDENNTSKDELVPEIFSFSKDTVSWGEELTIFGKDLGLLPSDGEIIFENGLKINTNSCIRWNHSQITFQIPINSKSGYIYIKFENKISNKLYLNIIDLSFLEMVEVPADTFQMGSYFGLKNELPVHNVILSRNLLISKYEITQFLYEYTMGENPSIQVANSLPVHNVKWLDAIKFCNTLSKRLLLDTCYNIDGEKVSLNIESNGFRLPTEAEWEYCCRAGSGADYGGTGALDEMGWYNRNSGFLIQKPGKKKPNGFGIYDMHGNVSEWCWDWYDENYFKNSPSKDPLGPDSGLRRVVRGGSVADGNDYARSSSRNFNQGTAEFVGFRLVRNK